MDRGIKYTLNTILPRSINNHLPIICEIIKIQVAVRVYQHLMYACNA
jgi:hypothetical protein